MTQKQVDQVLAAAQEIARPFDWKDIAVRVSGTRQEIMEALSILKGRGHLVCSNTDATTRTYTVTAAGAEAVLAMV